jgi:hypothetical protein
MGEIEMLSSCWIVRGWLYGGGGGETMRAAMWQTERRVATVSIAVKVVAESPRFALAMK